MEKEELSEHKDKQLDPIIEILKKPEKKRTTLELHQMVNFMNSYLPLQKHKTKMGFSIFRYFSERIQYKTFRDSSLLWKNPKNEATEEKSSLNPPKFSEFFNIVISGKIRAYVFNDPSKTFQDLSEDSTLAYVGEFHGEISEKSLKKLGVEKPVKVVSDGQCECFCLLREDNDIFFNTGERFNLSLSKKFNFLQKIPIFQDSLENSLIRLALEADCKELKIRSLIYRRGKKIIIFFR